MIGLQAPVLLIVDPDVLNSTAVASLLHLQQYEVFSVETSRQALAAARELDIDLILCEEVVGRDNGLELVRDIRRLPGREDVPVMFMTRHQAAGVERRTHDFGSAWHLKKPLDAPILIEFIAQTLLLPHWDQPRSNESGLRGQTRPPRLRTRRVSDSPVSERTDRPVGLPISAIYSVDPPHIPVSTPITGFTPSTV